MAAALLPAAVCADSPRRSTGKKTEFNHPVAGAHFDAPILTMMPTSPAPAMRAPEADETVVFEMHPTKEEFALCKVVDADNDGKTIFFYDVNPKFDWPIFYEKDLSAPAADDWIFTPAVNLDDISKLYSLSIYARAGATNISESFEIKAGLSPDPEAMTIDILSEPSCYNTDFYELNSRFSISEAGNYYIGIHITTKGWRTILRDLRICRTSTSGLLPTAPTDVNGFSSTIDGQLTATVNFTFPTTGINGHKLDASTKVTVTASTNIGSASVEGTPGSKGTVSVPCRYANSSVKLTSSSALGEGGSTTIAVVPQSDIPVDPVVSYRVSDDNMSLTISWNHVTEGEKGGVLNKDALTYNIYQFVKTETSEGFIPIKTGLRDTVFTCTMPAETPQQNVELFVTAKTDAGESSGNIRSTVLESLGYLYPLPMDEDLRKMEINYSGYNANTLSSAYDNATIGFSKCSSLVEAAGSGGAFCIISNYMNAKCLANFPRFAFNDTKNLTATLSVWFDDFTAPVDVYIKGSDGSSEKIGEIRSGELSGWNEVSFSIPDSFSSLPWAYLSLDGLIPTREHLLMIERIRIEQSKSNDFAVAAVSSVTGALGETVSVWADIRNSGFLAGKTPKVTARVMSGRLEMLSTELSSEQSTMAAGETLRFTGTLELKKADLLNRNLLLVVELTDDADMVAENNTASAPFTVRQIQHPVVTDLTGTPNAASNGVILGWSNPVKEITVDGFELYNHGEYGANIGPWTNIDFDRHEVYTVDGVPFPDEVAPKAFQVINHDEINSENFRAFEGKQYLIAFSAQTAQSDDWLLSPEIIADGVLEFELTNISGGFNEVLEIYTSSTDREIDSFKLLRRIENTSSSWKHYSVTLPDDARYFAFHYASNDQFAILIDNVAYKAAQATYELVGFHIYCNGERLTSTPSKALSYEHIHADFGTNSYNVSVVARFNGEDIEFPLSNTLNLSTVGVEEVVASEGYIASEAGRIIATGFEAGLPVMVYTPAGQPVASTKVSAAGTAEIAVAPGIYIVGIGSESHKIAVTR